MGTRGAYGIRLNGQDKVFYNGYDSYPSVLGNDMLKVVRRYTTDELEDFFDSLEDVSGRNITPEDIEACSSYGLSFRNVGTGDDWYSLLRDVQGDLATQIKLKIPFYEDATDFLDDPLFCEWAYIINLDDDTLEVYGGYDRQSGSNSRYRVGHYQTVSLTMIASDPDFSIRQYREDDE